MARIFVYDDREFPDPDPQMSVDQVKSTLSGLLWGDSQRLRQGDAQGQRHHLRVPAEGGHQGSSPMPKVEEETQWTPRPLRVCWRVSRRQT